MGRRQGIAAVMGLASVLVTTGCEDLLSAFEDDPRATINLFSTHHATPENGIVPDRGAEGMARVFDTDEGWTASLEGYVVTRGATLHRCDGERFELEFFSGTITEDLRTADLGLTTLGAVQVPPGDYCMLTVRYGPFLGTTDLAPQNADEEALDGSTVVLQGFAAKGDAMESFDIRVDGTVTVDLDLVAFIGEPLGVSGNEAFPVELTLSKTYDRFFDGIDFSDMASLDVDTHAKAVLEFETRVTPGTVIGG